MVKGKLTLREYNVKNFEYMDALPFWEMLDRVDFLELIKRSDQ